MTGFGGIFNGQCMEYYGDGGCGTVFTLSPPAQGQTAWTKQIIYDFKGNADGFGPEAPLLIASGEIFGGTFFGGDMNSADCMQQHGCGLIYQLTPPATGKTAWSKKTILAFKGPNGSNPQGGLTIDASGNLYGNGQSGGNEKKCLPGSPFPDGCGAVFELSPPAAGATEWDLTVFRFTNGADSSFPWDPPVQQGTSYFMTTSGDEVKSFGSIVALIPPAGAQTKWKEKTAFAFSNDANGCSPLGTLLLLGKTVYATTAGDGNGPAAWGTVFSYKP